MDEQLRILPGEDPDELISRAKAEHRPVATVCLFSGGHDSTVLAHRCRDAYDSLAFIDTGTALPGVRDFVVAYAAELGKPLRILEAGDEYRRMVLGSDAFWRAWRERWTADNDADLVAFIRAVRARAPEDRVGLDPPMGFPGAAQHGRAYNRLKERGLEQMRRELKEGHSRNARVLYVTGVRRAESARRRGRPALSRKGGMAFVNPLIDWTAADMRRYTLEHRLPESDVAALIHRSGECNCGAFAAEGEREMLMSMYPTWWAEMMGALEAEAARLGIPQCIWGVKNVADQPDLAGELCSSCEFRQLELGGAPTATQ